MCLADIYLVSLWGPWVERFAKQIFYTFTFTKHLNHTWGYPPIHRYVRKIIEFQKHFNLNNFLFERKKCSVQIIMSHVILNLTTCFDIKTSDWTWFHLSYFKFRRFLLLCRLINQNNCYGLARLLDQDWTLFFITGFLGLT